MMLWTMYEPKASKRRKASGWIGLGNPLDPVRNFIAQCKAQGMTYPETVETVKNQYNYFPTEAEIVVKDFWN